MPKYYVTVCNEYKYIKHPLGLHPDYFYSIKAPDIHIAKRLVMEQIGNKWAVLYTKKDLKTKSFKGGELPFPLNLKTAILNYITINNLD